MHVGGFKGDVITWNVAISTYAHNAHPSDALNTFREIPTKPNVVTLVIIIASYADLADVYQGMQIHRYVIINGFEAFVIVANVVIDMYAKCRCIQDAHQVFAGMYNMDVVSWNAIIGCYALNEKYVQVMELFQQLKIYTSIHPNVITWTIVIVGHAQHMYSNMALKRFNDMQLVDVKLVTVTLAPIMPSYAHLEALHHRKEIHEHVVKHHLESNLVMGNSLIEMYAKCGSVEYTRRVFEKIVERDLISRNAIIVGYRIHGHGKEALELFDEIQGGGINPNHITFIVVLSACSHFGLVDGGWRYFQQMSKDDAILP